MRHWKKRNLIEEARLLVYAPTVTWWAILPSQEVVTHLGRDGLHYGGTPPLRVPSAVFGGLALGALSSFFFSHVFPIGLLSIPFVLAGGWILGWRLGARAERRRQRQERIWCVRSDWLPGDAQRTVTPMGYESLEVTIDAETLERLLGMPLPEQEMEPVASTPSNVVVEETNGSKPRTRKAKASKRE